MELAQNSLHSQSDRWGQMYGKVFVMRNGTVLRRDAKGRPIDLPPENVQRGDIILDLALRPLRYSERLKTHG